MKYLKKNLPVPQLPMYNLRSQFCEQVFIPYLNNRHWQLLVINVIGHSVTDIDPIRMSKTNCDKHAREEKRAIGQFTTFIDLCMRGSKFSNLKNINWKIVKYSKCGPTQMDNYTCRILVQ